MNQDLQPKIGATNGDGNPLPVIPRLSPSSTRTTPRRLPQRWWFAGGTILMGVPFALTAWIAHEGLPPMRTPTFGVRLVDAIRAEEVPHRAQADSLSVFVDAARSSRERPAPAASTKPVLGATARRAPASSLVAQLHLSAPYRPSTQTSLTKNLLSGPSNLFHLITKIAQGSASSAKRSLPSAVASGSSPARSPLLGAVSNAVAGSTASRNPAQAAVAGRSAVQSNAGPSQFAGTLPQYGAAESPSLPVDSLSLVSVSTGLVSGSALETSIAAATIDTSAGEIGATPTSSSSGSGSSDTGIPSSAADSGVPVFPAGDNDALVVSQTVPPGTLVAGQTYQASVTMLNVGNSTWTSSGHFQLAYIGSDSFTWGTVPVWLDLADSIGPGQTKTFSFPVTAPQASGNYLFEWQMTQDGNAFGAATPSVTISVSSEAP